MKKPSKRELSATLNKRALIQLAVLALPIGAAIRSSEAPVSIRPVHSGKKAIVHQAHHAVHIRLGANGLWPSKKNYVKFEEQSGRGSNERSVSQPS